MAVSTGAFQLISLALAALAQARQQLIAMQAEPALPSFDLAANLIRADRIISDINTALKAAL